MAESKYGKYIITQAKPTGFVPDFFGPPAKYVEARDMVYLNDSVIKGGFYVEACWFLKGSEEVAVHPHIHDDYDEVLTFFGSNLADPEDLGGEIEEWIGDEKFILKKSCLVFVPKGVKHGPLIIRRVDRPIFHLATGNTPFYHGDKR
jgi:hypothetical protein